MPTVFELREILESGAVIRSWLTGCLFRFATAIAYSIGGGYIAHRLLDRTIATIGGVLAGFFLSYLQNRLLHLLGRAVTHQRVIFELGYMARSGDTEAARALADIAISVRRDSQSTNEETRKARSLWKYIRAVMKEISSSECIEAISEVYAESRSPFLRNVIISRKWHPQNPPKAMVLIALESNQLDMIKNGQREVIDPLVEYCSDQDKTISKLAQECIGALTNAEAIEQLFRRWVETMNPLLESKIQEAGYVPNDPQLRSIHLFLGDQWEKYEELDFDRRMLKAVYESGSNPLRSRIMDKLRAAGKIDYLTVITGSDQRARVMEGSEIQFVIQMLSGNKEWKRLWKMIFDLPYIHGIEALRTLSQSGWSPEKPDERLAFDELIAFINNDIIRTKQGLDTLIPPAIRQANVKISGRVNDVSFSPSDPFIAIGLGQGRAVIWDFERHEIKETLDNFAHSIGHVSFTKERLVLAERTQGRLSKCSIYAWQSGDSGAKKIGSHNGSITAIEPVQDEMVFSTGRDQTAVLWDTEKKKIRQLELPETWARGAKVSDDGKLAALLFDGIRIMSLPSMQLNPGVYLRKISCAAAFTPSGNGLIVGNLSGGVLLHQILENKSLNRSYQQICSHEGQIRGIEIMPDQNAVITGSSSGELKFTSLTDGKELGVASVSGMMTSLHISPDKFFMAVGESESRMSLWDLRVFDLPILFSNPLSKAVPKHLGALRAMLSIVDLSLSLRNTLLFVEKALQYRFRYDIEIDEIHTISPGDYDIEIE